MFFSIVSLLIVTGLTNVSSLFERKTCSVNGIPGICTHMLLCHNAIHDIISNRKSPETCSPRLSMVCCTNKRDFVAPPAVQFNLFGPLAHPQNYDIVAQSQNYDTIAQPQNYDTMTQPNNYDTVEQPQNYDTMAHPQNYDTVAHPKNYDTMAQPQNYDTVAHPQNYDTVARPKNYDILAQPKNYNTVAQPQKYDILAQPKNYDTMVQPQNYDTMAQPTAPPKSDTTTTQRRQFNHFGSVSQPQYNETVAQPTESPKSDASKAHSWQFDQFGPLAQSQNYDVEAHAIAPPKSIANTTQRSDTTTEYTTQTYVNKEQSEQCKPMPSTITPARTGQKAWDKCIEYQEKLVYPCERGVAMGSGYTRKPRCHHTAGVLVVGGRTAEPHEFPHMVMLGFGEQRNDLQWLCGGSLISERFVLTAAHCAKDPRIGPVTHITAGAFSRSETTDWSKVYEVNRTIKHPNYRETSKYHDIALLETKKEIKMDQYVVPGCLNLGDLVDDSSASATGWGLTSYGGSVSEELQKVVLTKFEAQECKAKFPVEKKQLELGFDANTQICYGDKKKSKDTCQGDSGGPLQIKSKKIHCMYVIIGVTSYGRACGIVGEPAIYTRVAAYIAWIESIVWP